MIEKSEDYIQERNTNIYLSDMLLEKFNREISDLIWNGIGEPDNELLMTCFSSQRTMNFNIDTPKNIHEEYISKVSR